jgi:hypothetical protein
VDAERAEVAIAEGDAAAHRQTHLFATVARDGIPVTGQAAEDHRVRKREVDRRPLTGEAPLPPLSVVPAVDVSGSMDEAMDATRAVATGFVEGLDDSDAAAMLRFARAVVLYPVREHQDGAPTRAARHRFHRAGERVVECWVTPHDEPRVRRRGGRLPPARRAGFGGGGAGPKPEPLRRGADRRPDPQPRPGRAGGGGGGRRDLA